MKKEDLRIVFMGTPEFAVETLRMLVENDYNVVAVVTQPDKPVGRHGSVLQPSPVKRYSVEHGLPVLQPEKMKDPQFVEQLRSYHANLQVVVAFRMLPEVVWAMPEYGTFNVHAALLPQYRGAAPINWAIINGEHETGVTTFLLNHHIDEGSILLQESTPITPDDNAGTLHDRLAAIGSRLVVRTIDGLADGTLTPRPQSAVDDLRPAPKIFKPDCAIDWRLPGRRIVDFVRGLSPYPAATMQMLDHKGVLQPIKVYQVAFEPAVGSRVGELFTDRKTYQKIGARDGYIHILSLQLSGKKRINIDEFLRGYDVTTWNVVL